MLKQISVILLCLAGLGPLACRSAAAQTVYKCTEDGKISYHDRPCGPHAIPLAVQPRDVAPAEAVARLERERALLQEIEDARTDQDRRDARQARENERAQRAAAARQRRCDKLRLQQKWLDEDAARAGRGGGDAGDGGARARTKARRQAEVLAVECPA
ncbi:DUF4124 domain-containing protein [Massilia sp. UMI-21]|nr:DUF4124 domain-containing protein [Massilia sp. UMI-21]